MTGPAELGQASTPGGAAAAATGPGATRPHRVRRGPAYWWHGYRTMLRFEVGNQRTYLPVFVVLQVMIGAGMAISYGFYFGGHLSPLAATYLTTGMPALALVPLGFVSVPAVVGQLRQTGCYDYVWSLPVPRVAAAAATFTVYTLVALPGTVVALLVAWVRYHPALVVHPSVLAAVLLASLMSTSVGFGMAHAISNPLVTNLISNVLIFFVLLFSPIVVPASMLPGWLAGVHRWLPFEHMAAVIRASLSDGLVTGLRQSYLVLGVWTLGSWLVAAWVIGRRR